MILSILLGVICFIGIMLLVGAEGWTRIIIVIITVGCFLAFINLNVDYTEKRIAIDCLNGKNPYKMEIQYQLKDSVYIPIDTLYIKIK